MSYILLILVGAGIVVSPGILKTISSVGCLVLIGNKPDFRLGQPYIFISLFCLGFVVSLVSHQMRAFIEQPLVVVLFLAFHVGC